MWEIWLCSHSNQTLIITILLTIYWRQMKYLFSEEKYMHFICIYLYMQICICIYTKEWGHIQIQMATYKWGHYTNHINLYMHMHSIFIHNGPNLGYHLKHVTLLLEQSNRQKLEGVEEVISRSLMGLGNAVNEDWKEVRKYNWGWKKNICWYLCKIKWLL